MQLRIASWGEDYFSCHIIFSHAPPYDSYLRLAHGRIDSTATASALSFSISEVGLIKRKNAIGRSET